MLRVLLIFELLPPGLRGSYLAGCMVYTSSRAVWCVSCVQHIEHRDCRGQHSSRTMNYGRSPSVSMLYVLYTVHKKHAKQCSDLGQTNKDSSTSSSSPSNDRINA